MSSELHTWADRLETVIAQRAGGWVDRVRVLAETGSTQDAVYEASGGRPGLAVIAGRQIGGRGRLGRAWLDDRGLGIAMSISLDAARTDGLIALRAGMAACGACESALARRCGLRWPNDVIEPGVCGRKLAGVLIEIRDGLAIVGVGINVTQQATDWPAPIAGRAVSLVELGSVATRIDTACALLDAFKKALSAPPGQVIAEWRSRDRLIGRDCAFIVGVRRIAGRVLDIDPAGNLTVRRGDGLVEELPAAQVSIDHGAALRPP